MLCEHKATTILYFINAKLARDVNIFEQFLTQQTYLKFFNLPKSAVLAE